MSEYLLTETETAQAKTDLVKSNERIAELTTQGDEARAQIVQGNVELEKERVERLKLEAKFAPRVITDEQVAALEKALRPLAGQSVDVVSYETLGTDVAEYAFVLAANLNHAGLHAIVFTPNPGTALVWGVVVRTEVGSSQEQVTALVKALREAGVIASPGLPYGVGEPIARGFMGSTGASPTAKLRVLVGAKPQARTAPDAR